jgi:hypothetical protein
MKKVKLIIFALMALFLTAATWVAADEETGTVTVIHGVPGLTVDVYVNGGLALPSFEPGTITDPLTLPAGDYDIEIYAAGADPEAGDPAIAGSTTLPAGANASIIAHLTEAGAPTLSVFVNDTSSINKGDARVVVRHTAAAPTVDVSLVYKSNEIGKIEGLSNPEEAQVEVATGLYFASILPAGTDDVVAGPARFWLNPKFDRSYIIYAIGSLADGTFQLLVQTIDLDANPVGQVTVVHGVPGLTVDVYVNGGLVLPNFEPYTVTDPLTLPEGSYDIEIYAAGADPNAGDPAIAGSAFLPGGANASIVAHLTEAGAPTLSVFVNDVSEIERGLSRLVVRHTAAAPTVDVSLFERRTGAFVGTAEGLSNPNEVQLELPRNRYLATIQPAGTDTVVFGPADLKLDPGFSYIVYAVGSLGDGSFTVLVQPIRLQSPGG